MLAGRINIMWYSGTTQSTSAFNSSRSISIFEFTATDEYQILNLNYLKAPLNNVSFREGLTYATDRNALSLTVNGRILADNYGGAPTVARLVRILTRCNVTARSGRVCERWSDVLGRKTSVLKRNSSLADTPNSNGRTRFAEHCDRDFAAVGQGGNQCDYPGYGCNDAIRRLWHWGLGGCELDGRWNEQVPRYVIQITAECRSNGDNARGYSWSCGIS